MLAQRPTNEPRSFEQLQQHYDIEKALAAKLRVASRNERMHLYHTLYDELYRTVPDHPTITRKIDPTMRQRDVLREASFLQHFVRADNVFLEIGAGDCLLSFEVTKRARHVYAVDVSEEVTRSTQQPSNFSLILSDGCSIAVPPQSIDVAYSNQLMEHLHPDDSNEQVQNIYTALKPGGVYICLTPSRLSGPHDISRYFDHVATGFHLREYTTTELIHLFKACGFSRVQAFVRFKQLMLLVPAGPVMLLERLLLRLPQSARRSIASHLPVSPLLSKVIAFK